MKFTKKELTVPEEAPHIYRDIDGIRIVYEDLGSEHELTAVGWYRPDGWAEHE